MECKFIIGDIVQLKSGGPEMTVSKITKEGIDYNLEKIILPFDGTIFVSWFDGSEVKEASFDQEMLVKL